MGTESSPGARLEDWIGRREEAEDIITPRACAALAATLECAAPAPGAPLPPAWHWIFFAPLAPTSRLGADGHERLGGFLPPVPLPQRMWAGGAMTFEHPLPVGGAARRVSTVANVTPKQGRSGALVFVQVAHDVFAGERRALTETQDIVYRGPSPPGAAAPTPPRPPEGAEVTRVFEANQALLFRYSALTFNAHRIHLDRAYCREEAGYPGLVVHAPLTATLLLGLAGEHRPARRIAAFRYRAVSPLFENQRFTLNAREESSDTLALWAARPDGALAMTAEARLAPA